MAEVSISVFGAGSWGTALAAVLARHGIDTLLWGRDAAAIGAMQSSRHNARYLGDIELPESLRYTASLAEAAARPLWLIVTPSHAFRELLEEPAMRAARPDGVAWATKGFEPGSGRFLHEVAASLLSVGTPLAVVTGPSFAREVALGLPTAVTVHSDQADFADQIAQCLHGPAFRAYTGNDMIGAELGGALKNVIAIAAGVVIGAGLGDSARAALMTRGFAEMMRLATALGAQAETLAGLSGFGDLVLTCTSDQSRNFRFGRAIGAGEAFDPAITVEGAATAKAVTALAQARAIEMPIAAMVAALVDRRVTVGEAMATLMSRPLKKE
jgi:glycerol-3-phosphate dehydrogenase (NAD(P)+)